MLRTPVFLGENYSRDALYLAWDDWRVLGLLADKKGGEHGERLSWRQHYRLVYRTPESLVPADLETLARVEAKLGHLVADRVSTGRSKNWYKTEDSDIPVLEELSNRAMPLSHFSKVVRSLGKNDQILLFCRPESRREADQIVQEVLENGIK